MYIAPYTEPVDKGTLPNRFDNIKQLEPVVNREQHGGSSCCVSTINFWYVAGSWPLHRRCPCCDDATILISRYINTFV